MGDFDTINYAQIVSNAEGVKGQQFRNQLLGQAVEQNKNVIERRRKMRKIEEEHKNRPARIAALHEAGMHEEARPLEEFHWQSLQNAFQSAENLSKVVTKENWKQTREAYINGGGNPAYMPVEYDAEWFQERKKETKGDLKKFSVNYGGQGANAGKTMSRDFVQQDGEIVGQGKPYEAGSQVRKPAPRAGSEKKLTPSDLNALYKFVANEFGGTFHRDPSTGTLEIFLEGEDAKMANDMALRAAALWEGGMSYPKAIETARQEVMPGSRPGRTIGKPDPLSLLGRP